MGACRKVPTNYKVATYVSGSTKITGAKTITRCNENEYTDGMHENCYTCDDAHQCHPSEIVTPCPHGHAKFGNIAYCTPCPPGSVCDIKTASGTTTAEGVTAWALSKSKDVAFPLFSPYLELTARACPSNNYCYIDGTTYHICPHGTYPTQAGCTECAEDKFCLTSFKREESVTSGSVSTAGDSFPRFKPQGYVWKGYTTGFEFVQDFTTDIFLSYSTTSALGRISMVTSTSETTLSTCPKGYSCTALIHSRCPSSHLGEIIGSEIIGTYSENQDVLHNYATTASVTLTKTIASFDQNITQCLACNAGYSCTLGSSPTKCNAGDYSPVSIHYCIKCPAGHYCPEKSGEPTACVANKFNSKVGSTVVGDCDSCPTGFYATAGSEICWPCPAGHKCDTGTPVVCSVGTYSAEGEIACSACQEGFACTAGSTISTPPEHICPKGSF